MEPLRLPLRTSRLTLRLHQESDAAWMHRVDSSPEVCRFLPYGPFSAEEAVRKNRQRMNRTGLDGGEGSLGLVLEYQGEPFGSISLWLTDRRYRAAEIGWVIDPDYSGKGLATEAVTEMLDAAFGHYILHRLEARVDPRNTASVRLARRVGMVHEDHLREDFWIKDE
ncbi:GNAT family N-acetyltransferase [Kocuria sp. TGY1127_2]|uniref:GNAT family N-acetyltransferase n=1 Tax=Kocuria sp. TGY1127_2 TaxID=2711328 RepID=UPI001FAC6B42|nr:GNAT family N-acetyltransferase [Kocuria sp. TGY1127_2]